MAMLNRIVATALAVSLLLLAAADADTAKRNKPRFKIIERTFRSAPFISLAGIALASRYPDTLQVRAPADSRIIDIDLHLYDFAHTNAEDIDVILVAPNGRTALVMSDAGGQTSGSGIDLTLDDDAKRRLPENGSLSRGRYRPANYDDANVGAMQASPALRTENQTGNDGAPGDTGEPGGDATPGEPGDPGDPGIPGGAPGFVGDDFPDPAPAAGDAVRLSTFHGMDPSGQWQLFIRADGPDAGSIDGGWGLTIEVKKRR